MVMSVAFVYELYRQFPNAEVSVIAKKGIHELLPYFPPLKQIFVFNKEENKGFKGLMRFGREIRDTEKFDLFFSLPDSFSSALIGFATGAKKRVGFKKELRSFLLTNSYNKPKGLHRVDEYLFLLGLYSGKKTNSPHVRLLHNFQKTNLVAVNINSEASSRRMTINKAVEEINRLRASIKEKIILIGAPKEAAFVDEVFQKLESQQGVENLAGKTNLSSLIETLASASVLLSTDSGPAHLSNALGTHTVVLFGAGKESNTAPYNTDYRTIIRLNKLSCEPCQKNICKKYEVPQCLQQLDVEQIISKVKDQL